MKEDKDTDRILGRKLASYEAKPRKLTFETLQKNYLVQKKISVTSGIITKASILVVGLGVTVGAWFFLSKNTTTPATAYQKTLPTDTTVSKPMIAAETNEPSYTSLSEINNPSETNTTPADKKDAETPVVQNNTIAPPEEKNNTTAISPGIKTSTKNDKYNSPKTNNPARTSVSSAKTNAGTLNTTASIKTTEDVKLQNKISTGADKIVKRQKLSTVTFTNQTKPVVTKNTVSRETNPRNTVESNTDPNGNTETVTNTPAKNIVPENYPTHSGKDPLVTDPLQKPGETIQLKTKPDVDIPSAITTNTIEKEIPTTEPANTGTTKTAEPATLSTDKKENAKETEPKTEVPAAVDTKSLATATATLAAESPSLTPPTHPKKHRLLFSTELLRNTTTLKFNVPFSDTSYTSPRSGATQTTLTNHFFSGALQLGYKYKNAGFNTGLGFLSIENEKSTSSYAQKQNLYATNIIQNITTTTSIITTTVIIPPIDSISPPVITTYTSLLTYTLSHTDTTYSFSGTRDYIVVNGDTVSPQNYLNQVRFFTIPFQVNYSFNLLRNRLAIEPQAGIQLSVPVSSYQLVHEQDGVFTYSKRKYPLKNSFVLFDANLKINYRLSRRLLLYVKQGYSFSGKTIYSNAYADKHKLSNLYSAVGFSFVFD